MTLLHARHNKQDEERRAKEKGETAPSVSPTTRLHFGAQGCGGTLFEFWSIDQRLKSNQSINCTTWRVGASLDNRVWGLNHHASWTGARGFKRNASSSNSSSTSSLLIPSLLPSFLQAA